MARYIAAEGNVTKELATGFGKESGKAWTHVEVAVTDSIKTDDGYVDGPTNYYRVSVFGSRAENAANSLTKGSRVVFAGSLTTRSFVRDDGQRGISNEVTADLLGASLTYNQVAIAARTGRADADS